MEIRRQNIFIIDVYLEVSRHAVSSNKMCQGRGFSLSILNAYLFKTMLLRVILFHRLLGIISGNDRRPLRRKKIVGSLADLHDIYFQLFIYLPAKSLHG